MEIGIYEQGKDTDTAEKIMFDPAETSIIVPEGNEGKSWVKKAGDGVQQLGDITVFYGSGGIGRVFMFTVE